MQEPNMFINSPHAEEDMQHFGRIVLAWGHLESTLLNIVLRVTHPRFRLNNHQIPQPLNQRIKLAKLGYSEIPEMAHLKAEALVILEALWPLSQKRHIIVHGYYQGYTGSETYMFTLYRRSKVEGRFHFYEFTRTDLAKLTDEIASISKKLSELSAKTFLVAFPPHSSKEK
jgi:hypothetical protein